MRYKKPLLIVFLLILFVLQQMQQVNASTPSIAQSSFPANNLLSYTQNAQMYVKLWRLNGNGTRHEPYTECATADLDNSHGCVENPSNDPNLILYYPYNTNPALVDVENDYLVDVVAREMPAQYYPNPSALAAQAVAARSYANYQYDASDANGYKIIANDTRYQVFIPYAFDAFLGTGVFPINVNSCDNNLNSLQQKVCDAVTSTARAGVYLAPHNSDQPAKTQFSADWGTLTNTGDEPYLQGVSDPISTCGVDTNGSHGWGLNQKGANRWALGNQCATASDGNESWPVKWDDPVNGYKQILVHYYTGIDILNASGGKVAPDDRWNLLNYNLPNTTAIAGTNFTVNVTLQNTSTTDWATDRFYLSFYARRRISPLGAG